MAARSRHVKLTIRQEIWIHPDHTQVATEHPPSPSLASILVLLRKVETLLLNSEQELGSDTAISHHTAVLV